MRNAAMRRIIWIGCGILFVVSGIIGGYFFLNNDIEKALSFSLYILLPKYLPRSTL